MLYNDLYQEIILEHYKHPRNKKPLDHLSDEHIHENPSCGDSIKLEILFDARGYISEVSFDGKGCAISMASASMMSDLLTGQPADKGKEILETFLGIMRGEESVDILEDWGDPACLSGLVHFPVRIKCATLAWHAAVERMTRVSHEEKQVV